MTSHVLLVEPDYYSRYPPLGLLKLSAYHKKQGDTTELAEGIKQNFLKIPEIIYITSLFTWSWEPVWKAVQHYSKLFPKSELWLGGLYASLMPEHAKLSGISENRIWNGLFDKAEDLLPDYSLVPDWNKKERGSIVFASRGCIRKCTFCAVPRIEGKLCSEKKTIKQLIWPDHKRIIFFDNNFLASAERESILDELIDLNLMVDFNQGLDARLINEKIAKKISKLRINPFLRISYDNLEMTGEVKKAIYLLKSAGINERNILVYSLYNFTDTPQDLFERIKNVLTWGAVSYPMRYQPTNTRTKNTHVGNHWDEGRLGAVQTARRVIGRGGAFPPYKGMLKVKVEGCQTFDDAFGEFVNEKEVS